MCPPRPVNSMRTVSEADVIAPIRVPTWPTSTLGSQCRANIRGTPSRTPWRSTVRAPPGSCSSAGWKTIRTVPAMCAVRCRSASTLATPTITVAWMSCPQECATPSLTEEYSRPVPSWIGSASMSARRPTPIGPCPMST